jgi:hypothetical protein
MPGVLLPSPMHFASFKPFGRWDVLSRPPRPRTMPTR